MGVRVSRGETKVLVVDDNLDAVTLLEAVFEMHGMAVEVATSIEDAKTAVERADPEFDLIVSDVALPDVSGFDFLRWLKRSDSPHASIPVLLVTAMCLDPDERYRAKALGAADLILRPVDLREMVERVCMVIADGDDPSPLGRRTRVPVFAQCGKSQPSV